MPDIFTTKPNKTHSEQILPKEKIVSVQEEAPIRVQSNDHAIQSIENLIRKSPSSMRLFSAYSTRPKGITFANQEPDEAILLFLRRHFITNIPWILLVALLTLIPPVFFALLSLLPPLTFPKGITTVLTTFYYLLVLNYAFGKFISWFYNIGVVTQKRIIDLDSHNILSHNTATANFNEIVDVKFDQRGFFQSTFDYGNIHIQTEAIRANFEFDAAPKPTIVTDVISDLRVAQKGVHHGGY